MDLDTKLFYSINHLPHNKLSDGLAIGLHYLTYYGWIFGIPVIYFYVSGDPTKKLLAKQLAFSMIAAGVVNDFVMRPLVMRARPFTVLNDVITVGKLPGEYSFPSGHTTIAFAFAVTYFLVMPKTPISYLLLTLALVIGLSRVYMGFHYPSDVLVGALIGVVFAFISIAIFKE